ncbi:MAG TPA: alpha-galactosidase [Nocardioidaceae bacterium]|nr:alpha-galactosidase [Nocardioidaceae bacterium]
MSQLTYLRGGNVGMVIAAGADRLPQVLHWGADLGTLQANELTELLRAAELPVVPSGLDEPYRPGLLPEASHGFNGTPGLQGFALGRPPGPQPQFDQVHNVSAGPTRFSFEARDTTAKLTVRTELELDTHGVARMRHTVGNIGDTPYALTSLYCHLPLANRATELLDLTGRWIRERTPQRRPLTYGTWRREGRHGRTGHDAPLLMVAGTAGFGFRHGEVWGAHVAWSGDHVTFAERLPEGYCQLGGGELLGPGEVILAPGNDYSTPWLYAVWSDAGLDGISGCLHEHLRARAHHPERPRPVVLNTWEAVYFDHDLDRLSALADVAAEVGVERFVLDDGWFRGRRHDGTGLGDWYVDEQIWPQGLTPLIEHVTGHGMEFGLWVEPEMVNMDSHLARAHPDWVLRARSQDPPSWRRQQVLDLANPQAYSFVLQRLSDLLSEDDIAFLKWDHNRDLIDTLHEGAPAVHGQTQAVYRLLEELRSAFPSVEIESCASGGARVDLEILQHTDRVWASDTNDALERQRIQRWTGLLLPPELVGSHVGPPLAHTTGRTASLGFRAGTALFGHFGIEWDITATTPQERAELRRWITLYKQERALLHRGVTVRVDHADPAVWVHGVVSTDGLQALFAVVQMATSVAARPGPISLAGLSQHQLYRVEVLDLTDNADTGAGDFVPSTRGNLELSGRALMRVGIEIPTLNPERLLLLRVRPADTDDRPPLPMPT